MISYEKAVELKEAGFKQGGLGMWWDKTVKTFTTKDIYSDLYQPTLSELIEACGDRFYGIMRGPFKKYWEAGEYWGYEEFCGTVSQGTTPEEAVANLYLELNKK